MSKFKVAPPPSPSLSSSLSNFEVRFGWAASITGLTTTPFTIAPEMFFLDEAWESTYLRESSGAAPLDEGYCEFALWGWCIGGRPVVLPVLGVLSDSGGGGLPLLFDLADGGLSILGFFWFPFYLPTGALFIIWIGKGGTKDWPLLAGERIFDDTALGLVYCSISRQAFSAILSLFESFSLFSF